MGRINGTCPPIIEGAKENFQKPGYPENHLEEKILITDSNYHSKESLEKCEEEKIDAYIPDVQFRKRDPRFSTQHQYKGREEKRFTLEDFQ